MRPFRASALGLLALLSGLSLPTGASAGDRTEVPFDVMVQPLIQQLPTAADGSGASSAAQRIRKAAPRSPRSA